MLIRQFVEETKDHDGPILLDGHLVIPSESGMVPVEASVFRRLGVTHMFLLSASPEVVATRLASRDQPRWWDGQVSSIETLIAQEAARLSVVSGSLGCPAETLSELEPEQKRILIAAVSER